MTFTRITTAKYLDSPCVVLPPTIASKVGKSSVLHFGLGEEKVEVVKGSTEHTQNDPASSAPASLEVSPKISSKLAIPNFGIYQLLVADNEIYLGPVVGLLLGNQYYCYHDRYMNEFRDALGVYPQVGGLYIAFRHHSIDWSEKCIYGLAYKPETQCWVHGKYPLPSVIYRRSYATRYAKIQPLIELTEGRVFNSKRLNKQEMYDLLKSHPTFAAYLPETVPLDRDGQSVADFLDKYGRIVVKPSNLSRGRGIYMLQKDSDVITILSVSDAVEEPALEAHNLAELKKHLKEQGVLGPGYLMQPYIPLAKINGAPWDIRLVMQRDYDKRWHCNGIECRVAGPRRQITNISRGGQAISVSHAALLSFGPTINPTELKRQLTTLGKLFCRLMDQTGEHYGEFGLDLALDTSQQLWFIEANVRPTYNGFKRMNREVYDHICRAPIRYAASLSGFEGR